MKTKYFDILTPALRVSAKLMCENPRAIDHLVIFCHGFAGHKDTKAAERFAEYLLAKYHGYAVLIFDWPCHGSDVRKKLTLEDCDSYLTAVLTYAGENYEPKDFSACATSFGGYLVLKYLSEHGNPFRKVVLRCPAIPMYESMMRSMIEEEQLALLAKGKEVQVGFDRRVPVSQTFLDELKENDLTQRDFLDFADDLLIVHGTKDEIIPFEEVKAFSEENVIDFLPVENADHRFSDPNLMKLAISKMGDFLAK